MATNFIELDPCEIGQLVTFTFTFRDSAGTLTNPGAAACSVLLPSGSTTTVSLSNSSTGVYVGTFTPTLHGDHYFFPSGTAPLVASATAHLYVSPIHL